MVTRIGAPGKMARDELVYGWPGENAGFSHSALCKRVEQKRFKNRPEPMVRRDVEALLGAGQHARRDFVPDEFAKNVFQSLAVELKMLRKPGGEFDNAMVEKRGTNFKRMRHRHPVALIENVIGQVIELVKPEIPIESADRARFGREAAIKIACGPVGDTRSEAALRL